MRFFLVVGALALLGGCAESDTTWTEQVHAPLTASLASMWGPCREVALARFYDEQDAGFDAETIVDSLPRTYDDCVVWDKRSHFKSIYDGPHDDPGPATEKPQSGGGEAPI